MKTDLDCIIDALTRTLINFGSTNSLGEFLRELKFEKKFSDSQNHNKPSCESEVEESKVDPQPCDHVFYLYGEGRKPGKGWTYYECFKCKVQKPYKESKSDKSEDIDHPFGVKISESRSCGGSECEHLWSSWAAWVNCDWAKQCIFCGHSEPISTKKAPEQEITIEIPCSELPPLGKVYPTPEMTKDFEEHNTALEKECEHENMEDLYDPKTGLFKDAFECQDCGYFERRNSRPPYYSGKDALDKLMRGECDRIVFNDTQWKAEYSCLYTAPDGWLLSPKGKEIICFALCKIHFNQTKWLCLKDEK